MFSFTCWVSLWCFKYPQSSATVRRQGWGWKSMCFGRAEQTDGRNLGPRWCRWVRNQPTLKLTSRLLVTWENEPLYCLSYFNLALCLFDLYAGIMLLVQKWNCSSSPHHASWGASALHEITGAGLPPAGNPSAATKLTSGEIDPTFYHWLLHLKNGNNPSRNYPL